MAYAAATTVTRYFHPQFGRTYTISVAETEAASGSEFSVDGLPSVGTITFYQATLTAGTGTTIQPKIGKATGWSASTQNVVATQATAAVHIHDTTRCRYVLPAGTDTLFFASQPDNAAADHSISTILEIVEGHLP